MLRNPLHCARSRRLILVAGTLLTSASVVLGDNETHVYGVADFGGSGCLDADDTHDVHEDTADAFDGVFDVLEIFGLWDDSFVRNNTSCRGSYWEDATDDDVDEFGVDAADIAYIHTHGGHTVDTRSTIYMGNDSYDCSITTDDDLEFDVDLDIAIIKACQSGDYGVWENGGYRAEFTEAASSLRMWNAFHGDSSCGDHVTSYVGSYAWDSIYNGAGENWIDEAYDNDGGVDSDDCPCSIVMGSSRANRDLMFEYGGWRDRKDTGDKTSSTYYYISGCDPDNGTVLP